MSQLSNKAISLICVEKRRATDDVIVITLAHQHKQVIAFSPGQYITLSATIEGKAYDRCYTISSCPEQSECIEIIVKRVSQGAMSNWLLDQLGVGDIIKASEACGQFHLGRSNKPKLLLLSAGVGVTPLLSMLRHIAKSHLSYEVIFHHSAKTSRDIIAADELSALGDQYPHLTISYNLTRERANSNSNQYSGHICDEILQRICTDVPQRDVFVCGPNSYMERVQQILSKQGLPSNQYFQEDFEIAPLAAVNESNITYTIDFCHSNCRTDISSGETVLDAALRLGIDLDTSCSSGICGSCSSYIIEGNIAAPQAQAIDEEDISSGEFLPCCSYPLSNLKVDL